MRIMVFSAVLLFLALWSRDVFATTKPELPPPVDTTIRVLLVADSRLSANDVNEARSYLLTTWSSTSFQTAFPTTITIANGGIPLVAGASVFSGEADDQIGNLRNVVEFLTPPLLENLRDYHAADVVIGLTSVIDGGGCGQGPQDNWLGLFPNFQITSGVHDLREADDDYIGLARISGNISCQPYLAAHEFGHLLGAGHRDSIHNFNGGLLSNSKALSFVIGPPVNISDVTYITVLGWGPNTVDCPSPDVTRCSHMNRYSDFAFSDSSRRNAEALRMTARSVANYRSGVGPPNPSQPQCTDTFDNDGDGKIDSADPDCAVCMAEYCPPPPQPPPPDCSGTLKPTNVIGSLIRICEPDGSTSYRVTWSHLCPQNVTSYQVWYQQPLTSSPAFGWISTSRSTALRVLGQDARIKIKACDGTTCSGLSSSSFVAVDRC
jgi:hypothetical protein